MSRGTIYRLKNGNPNSWALKQKEVGITVPGKGFKYINYFEGGESIFVDENKDRTPKKIMLEDNGMGHTEIIVPNENILLNTYLQKHPWFKLHFEIYSEEETEEKKLAEFELREEALDLIREKNDIEIQAIALAINGYESESYGWTPNKSRAWLKQTAFETPKLILDKTNSNSYESRYFSAMAFYTGIVRENNHKNRVVWNDDAEGTIAYLAKGENGIDSLAKILGEATEESRLVIQEISNRIDKLENNSTKPASKEVITPKVDNSKELSEKDAYIKELEARLAKKEEEDAKAAAIKPEPSVEEDLEEIEEEKEEVVMTLEEAQKAFVEKFKKNVPPRFTNDLEYITKKLAENI